MKKQCPCIPHEDTFCPALPRFQVLISSLCLVGLMFLSGTGLWAQASLNMTLVGQYDDNTLPLVAGGAYNDCWGYTAAGREYGIIGTANGTIFVDITNPATPVFVSYEAGGAPNSIWRDYKTYKTYCYAVQDGGGNGSRLQIFDLSGLPGTVTKVYESNTFFSRAHNVFVEPSSGRLYVAGANTLNSGIIVLDIGTNPALPTLLGNFNLGHYSHDVYCRNDTLYCFMGNYGMEVWDFTNLASINPMATLTSYPEKGYNHSGWCTDDHNILVFADETHNTGLKTANVSNHNTINVLSTFRSTLLAPTHTNSIAHNPIIDGNLCYISYYHDGVQVYDISDPNNVTQAAYYDTEPGNTSYAGYEGVWGAYPYLPSGRVIASDLLHGLFVFEMNLSLPVEFGTISADRVGGRVRVNWETHVESNNSHFMVERSSDAGTFEELGRVEGGDNSSSAKQYAFWDESPIDGLSYYRLKQVDHNGESHFSETVALNPKEDFQILVAYPNPVAQGHEMRVGMDLFEEGTVTLRFYDLMGKIVWSQSREVVTGRQEFFIPTTEMSRGAYLLKVQGPRTSFERKVIVN